MLTQKIFQEISKLADRNTAAEFANKPMSYLIETKVTIYFCKAKDNKTWVLGFPTDLEDLIYLAMFKHGCTFIQDCRTKNKTWVNFKTSNQIFLAKCALNFQCPTGREPLVIGGTPQKPVILYGNAAKNAKHAHIQKLSTLWCDI